MLSDRLKCRLLGLCLEWLPVLFESQAHSSTWCSWPDGERNLLCSSKAASGPASSGWRARGRAAFFLRQDVHGGIWLVLRDDLIGRRAIHARSRTQNPSRSMWNDRHYASCVFPTSHSAAAARRS